MRDDQTITAFGSTLTEDDAIAFITEKSVGGSSCPVCATLKRTILLTGPDDETAVILSTAASVEDDDGDRRFQVLAGARFMPIFSIWCENCGHLQMHTLGTLAAWVRERRSEERGEARGYEEG